MPIDNPAGNPVPTALIPDPFAHQFSLAAQGGNFSMSDGGMNPLDLFSLCNPSDDPGVAVVILNCLPTPLLLVDTYFEPADNWNDVNDACGPMLSYPLTGQNKAHLIPGACPYPCQAKNPGWLAGLGLYRFKGNTHRSQDSPPAIRALAFSLRADGAGPRCGVLFGTGQRAQYELHQPRSHVSAFLDTDLKTFHDHNLIRLQDPWPGAVQPTPKQWDIGPAESPITIWASFDNLNLPRAETKMRTLTVWVRDNGSPVG